MRVFALNCGSSSIKGALIETVERRRLLDLRIEDLGSPQSLLTGDDVQSLEAAMSLPAAVELLIEKLMARFPADVQAIAHRVVHGGERFTRPTLLDEAAIAAIAALDSLAPLHNPPAVAAIRVARRLLPNLPQLAVFDTAFHSTLPRRAREYALPSELTRRRGLRRYGFHGSSHSYVMAAVAAHLHAAPQELRIISCHLGNGASVAAIEYGRSVDTSMGMTPLEGLVMGTRAGDLDPGVLLNLVESGELDSGGLATLLNKESGLKGLTGTHDMREIERRAAEGDEGCRAAITLYAHRARKYVGAYAAVMGGVDAIAFTGGVGENSALVRHRIGQRLEFLGARLDEDRNREARVSTATPLVEISAASSRARMLVVRADEELAMALEAEKLLRARATPDAAVRIPISISARHAHLSQQSIDSLFGPGYRLRVRKPLSQHGQFAAEETISLIGPAGRLQGVRILGPPRIADQVEISRSDEFVLGVDAPVRLSGDLQNTPGITLEGPRGRVTLKHGVICARRHIHMNPADAQRFGVKDHDTVEVRIDSAGRDLTFGDVVVRVSPEFQLEMHLDTDEGNAAGLQQGDAGELRLTTAVTAALRISAVATATL